MPDPEHSEIGFPDAVQLFRSFARVAESSQRLVLDFLTRAPEFSGLRMADRRVGEAFLELTAKMLSDPVALARAQIDLWTEHARLWTTSTHQIFGLADHSADMGPPIPALDTRPGVRSLSSTTSSRAISSRPSPSSRPCAASKASTKRRLVR